MAQQYSHSAVQKLPAACTLDITPPTFAGVASVTPQDNGSLLVAWLAGSDLSTPISYEIYCLPDVVTAAVLFAANPCLIVRNALLGFLFYDSNGIILEEKTYTIGVRARDAVGNIETNLVILTAASSGILQDSLLDTANALLLALQTVPNPNEIVGVIESESVEGEVSDADALTLALSGQGGGGGFTGDEVVIYPTITSGQETSKSLTLPLAPDDDAEVKVEWIGVGAQVYGVDFTVTGTTLSWAGLGMETEGLSAGDKLRIVYLSQ